MKSRRVLAGVGMRPLSAKRLASASRPRGGATSAGLTALLLAATTSHAATTSTWQNSVSGNWTDATKWSTNPNYPNNGTPAGATYDAVISATGSAYTVTLNSNVTTTSVVLNSADALLDQGSGNSQLGTLSLQSGVYQLRESATLAGTTISGSGSARFDIGGVSPGVLSGVTLATTANILNNFGGKIINGITLSNGTINIGKGGADNATTTYLTLEGTQSISGTGTISFEGNAVTNLLASHNGTLTIGPNITVQTGAQNGTVGDSQEVLVTQGTISARTSGKRITVTGSSVTNQGVMEAINGSTLNLAGTWTNTGTLRVNNSTLNLGGAFTTAGIGTIDRTSGSVNITGALNNSGGTLALNAASGTWNVVGGTISGGTISTADSVPLMVTRVGSTSGGTFSGVSVSGDVVVYADSGTTLVSTNGLTLNGGHIHLQGGGSGNAGLSFSGAQSFGGSGDVVFEGSTQGGSLSASGGTTTVGPNIRIYTGTQGGTISGSLTNQGTISSETSGKIIAITATNFTNSGLIEAKNGGIVDFKGIFPVTALGNFNSNGGVVRINTGTLNLTGNTLTLSSTTGPLTLGNSSFINGGTVVGSGGGKLQVEGGAAAQLNSTVISSEIAVPPSAVLVANSASMSGGSIHLQGNATQALLYVPGNTTLGGTGDIVFDVGFRNNVEPSFGTMTLGPGITIRTGTGSGTAGGSTAQFSIIQGLISAETSGQKITIAGTSSGGAQMLNGASIDMNGVNNGTMTATGSGTFTLGGNWTNNGTITVTNSNLTLTGGALAQGTINLTGSNLNLQMSRTTAQMEAINYSTTRVQIQTNGLVTNTGDTINLNATTGSWELAGGRILNGSITSADGSIIKAVSGSSILDGVSLASNVTVQSGATLSLNNAWSNGATITSAGTLNLAGTFNTAAIGTISRTAGSVNITGALNNASATLGLTATTGTWNVSSTGSITGGNITASGGAALNLNGGTLSGVTSSAPITVASAAQPTIQNGLTLSSAALTLTSNSPVSDTLLNFTTSPALAGAGEVVFNGSFNRNVIRAASGTLDLGANITVRSGTQGGTVGQASSGINNQGTISSQTAARTISVTGNSLTNPGLMQAISNGALAISVPTWTNAGHIHLDTGTVTVTGTSFTNDTTGVIDGNGTLNVSGTSFTNNGFVSPGLSPGLINVTGNYTQGSTGTLVIEIAGTASNQYDRLAVSGAAALGGTLDLRFLNGFLPAPGDSFQFLTASGITGSFANVASGTAGNAQGTFDVIVNGTSITLSNFVAVPEPTALGMLSLGSLVLLRRRRAA